MDNIKNIYESKNFPSKERLYKYVKEAYPNITRKEIDEFLDRQKNYQLLKQQITPRTSGHITAFYVDEVWQIDIYVMKKYEKYNKNYGYMLSVIDVFSRRMTLKKMKTKTGAESTRVLQDVIDEWKSSPRIIMSDNDKAFKSSEFQKILNKYNIILDENVLNDHKALGIIDRLARTVKTILMNYFLYNKTKSWIDKIDDIIEVYNNTEHGGLNNLTPNQAAEAKHHTEVFKQNLQKNLKNKTVSDLKEGDKVRVRVSGIFTKGTEPKWSDDFQTVKKISGATITLDNNQRFKRPNLLKIPDDTQPEVKEKNIIRKITKEYKNELVLRKEGISEGNIQREKRDIKKPSRFKD